MKKRLLSLLVVLALGLGLFSVPAAASGSGPVSADHAVRLHALHLFQGTSGGYRLDDTATRLQGLIMLIRLLGLEDEALAYTGSSPFTDTSSPYAAYAYAKGLTRGVTASSFQPGGPLSARNYLTFLFRALGYDDRRGDFSADDVLSFARSISLISGDAAAPLASMTLNRGDMADLSFAALTCKMRDSDRTLAEKLRDDGVFTQAEGEEANVLGRRSGWVYSYTPYTPKPAVTAPPSSGKPAVQYERRQVSTSGGSVTAHVVTVDPKRADIKTAVVNKSMSNASTFSHIVRVSGAEAVINGSYLSAYGVLQNPAGHVMSEGELFYANSGLTSFGFTDDGEIRVGRPSVCALVRSGQDSWLAQSVNVAAQTGSVLYTSSYGPQVVIQQYGFIMIVRNGVITSYSAVTPSTVLAIPDTGFLLYMDSDFASAEGFRRPSVRHSASLEYCLDGDDAEGFTLEGVTSIISGAPRLVQDGAIVTKLEPGFQDARFTTAVLARTAIGVTGEGSLLMVSTPYATIQQMREVMLSLGCVDAINLDGGDACGMYCRDTYFMTPGRALTVTLQATPK